MMMMGYDDDDIGHQYPVMMRVCKKAMILMYINDDYDEISMMIMMMM